METQEVSRPLILAGVSAMGFAWHGAQAQSAGSLVVSTGWAHAAPQTGSGPLAITSIGGQPVNIEVPGSGSGARSGDTVGLAFEYYVSDHIGAALIGGWPSTLQLEGRGTLAQYGVIGEARAWSPSLALRYHFGEPQNRLRPFAGVGINYTWFTDAKVKNSDFVAQSFGPGGSATAKASSSWSPVFQAGFDYRFSERWAAGVTVSYQPTDTNVTLVGRTAAGTEIVSRATVRLRPIITYLNISYTF